MRQLFTLCFLAFLIFPSVSRAEYSGGYPYKAVATVGMVADVVRAVGGEKAQVESLMGAGVDPHTYAPSRNDVAQLMRADVIFYNGLLLEGRMTDTFVKLGRQKPIYAVTELIPQDYLLEHGDYEGQPDPHVWMDVAGWMRAVEAVQAALAEFDPANTSLYEANAKAYLAKLEKLHAYAKERFATIPEDRRIMITAHDAFGYMGRAYGIEVAGIQGLSTESEAGLADINNLVDMLVEKQIPAVFVETSVSDKNVRALLEGAKARSHEVRIGGTLFSDAMGPADTYEGTYVGMLDHNITTIVRSLGGDAPERGMQGKLSEVE